MTQAQWFFDYISPFSYLQSTRLDELSRQAALTLRPVLFAALLDAHGQLGPAEIPSKRTYTFRHVLWAARRHGIPIKLPPVHPFNPLPALRLTVALGATAEVVRTVFDFIWREGNDIGDRTAWQDLAERVGVSDADALIADPDIKDTLRRNGEEAISLGVFGVPTLVVDDELFWGFDGTEFFLDYVRDPQAARSAVFEPVGRLAQGAARRRKGAAN
jgi:2-hydroxychromene-2-carboxylate isomerase